MDSLHRSLLLLLMGSLLVVTVQAIKCECTTEECLDEGKSTCYAVHFCYSEYFKDTLTRGCIDEGSSLLCENRRPKGIDYWPSLYCCYDRDLCNKDVTPTLPSANPENKVDSKGHKPSSERDRPEAHNPHHDHNPPVPPCQNEGGSEDDAARSNSGGSKVINPIYIAVPVAGVCVLLALVIFAMYLLRRRNHHYDNYHHYHDHLPATHGPHGHKQPGAGAGVGTGGGGEGGGGIPLYHHHQHCDCICKKSLPPCGGKVNRCTDSERSSSGSETKLFLQA